MALNDSNLPVYYVVGRLLAPEPDPQYRKQTFICKAVLRQNSQK